MVLGLLLLLWATLFSGLAQAQNLQSKDYTCNKPDGEEIEIPSYLTVSLISNIKCFCVKGVGQCRKITDKCFDDLKGCHFVQKRVTNATNCEKECRPCHTPQGIRHSDEVWSLPKCQVAQCHSGVITTSQVQCPTPMCPNPVTIPGDCCPSCKGCSRAGQFFKEGESKPDLLNSCNECTCRKGHLECVKRACPVLPCSRNLIKSVKGQCCPICARPTDIAVPQRKCIFRNNLYYPGQTIPVDSCTKCQCVSTGTIECQRETCPELKCSLRDQKWGRDKCCPECLRERGVAKALPAKWAKESVQCHYQGKAYKDGNAWTSGCQQCQCFKGEVTCSKMKCPVTECPSGAKLIPGKCCPSCEYQDGKCTVFGDPHYKTFDGRIFNFQGSCKYLLSKDGCGLGQKPTFSVRITNDARDSYAFSWSRTVTVRIFDDVEGDIKISLMQKMKVKINGKKVALPYIKMGQLSVMIDGYRVILRTINGKLHPAQKLKLSKKCCSVNLPIITIRKRNARRLLKLGTCR